MADRQEVGQSYACWADENSEPLPSLQAGLHPRVWGWCREMLLVLPVPRDAFLSLGMGE